MTFWMTNWNKREGKQCSERKEKMYRMYVIKLMLWVTAESKWNNGELNLFDPSLQCCVFFILLPHVITLWIVFFYDSIIFYYANFVCHIYFKNYHRFLFKSHLNASKLSHFASILLYLHLWFWLGRRKINYIYRNENLLLLSGSPFYQNWLSKHKCTCADGSDQMYQRTR